MKRTLREDLERIHSITYGKDIIQEQGLLDNILRKVGLKNDKTQKIDDPKKADLVSGDVNDFFSSLQRAADGEGLSQQQSGGMTYQKEVESMQIGLILLGYELPNHGVDGLFGPETAAAVSKFINEKVSGDTKTSINEAFVKLGDTSYSNIKFDKDGTQYDQVNQALLDDLQTAASKAGIVITITTAKSGHSNLTVNGRASRHATNTAVDVAILDGVSAGGATSGTNGNSQFRELGTKLKNELVNLGYSLNAEGGNQKAVLWQTNTGGNHFNHLHVSNNEGVSGSAPSGTIVKATPEMLRTLIQLLKQRGVKSEELKQYIDSVKTGGGAAFTDLDLTTEEGFKAYAEICQKFINIKKPNPLAITGEMMASAAKRAFERYQRFVPAELALAQMAAEGGIGNANMNSRPIRTKNPFNVGNVDDGSNVSHNNVQAGIDAYYNLIAKDYIGKGKTANDLVTNFVNKNNQRYASSTSYENVLSNLAGQANRLAQPVVASINKPTDTNIT